MRTKRVWTYLILLIVGGLMTLGVEGARAYRISDDLTVSGFARTELGIHTGFRNPNNAGLHHDNYRINLFKSTLLTDWVYKPSDQFKLFAQFRFMDDSTERVGDNLPRYNAFPTFSGDGLMARWRDRHDALEVREFYADISVGNLWLRLGKQQIVWGETDAIRLLDVFNPLDLTKHLFIEPAPEQFENIRIPLWALRATYLIPNRYINDLTVEGVFNPGNIVHTQLPELGAPFNLVPQFPPFIRVSEDTRFRELSGGGRIYGSLGPFGFTLNYLYSYNQDGIFRADGLIFDPIHGIPILAPIGIFTPFSILARTEHPKINIYGGSFNYYSELLKAVIRAEIIYIPDQPYQSARDQHEIIQRGTLKYVLGLDRPTFFFPRKLVPHAATVGLQFFQTVREGDEDDLLINNDSVDKTDNSVSVFIEQPFYHDQVFVSFLFVYDVEDAYWIQPGFKYKPGVHWMFDVYANFLGGSDDRPSKLGSFNFANGILARISYQF